MLDYLNLFFVYLSFYQDGIKYLNNNKILLKMYVDP